LEESTLSEAVDAAVSARVKMEPMPNEATAPGPTFDERRTAAWIGKALRIEGKVISHENLTIDGQVEGTIEVGDQSLTIGAGAAVTADLTAKTITISGAVTGNVVASDKVDLRATGSVDGDIAAPRLFMADGAIIRGRVEIRGNKADPAPG
jgi:cytoskeletal protein CcmA (bactofilin family)